MYQNLNTRREVIFFADLLNTKKNIKRREKSVGSEKKLIVFQSESVQTLLLCYFIYF